MLYFETKDGNVVKNKEEFFDLLTNDGKRVIKKFTKKRSLDQNAYMRAIIDIISNEVGEDKDYIHESLKMKFLTDKSRNLPFVKSTSKLTTKEFGEYIENIKDFMSTFGIILPEANDLNLEKYYHV